MYLWTHPLFLTDAFKNFSNQLLTSVLSSEEGTGYGSSRLEAAMPEVVGVMKTNNEAIYGSMKALETSLSSMNKEMKAGFSNQQQDIRVLRSNLQDGLLYTAQQIGDDNMKFLSLIYEPLSSLDAESLTSMLSSFTTVQPVIVDNERPILYRMNRNFVMVTYVWREYDAGIMGESSIHFQEKQYGTGWRKGDAKEVRFLSRRMTIIREIERLAVERHLSGDEAAVVLEKRRVELKMALDKLRKTI